MKTTPIILSCAKRGCIGMIEVSDDGEIGDGQEGVCNVCGRVYVATAWEDGGMSMVYDRSRTAQEKRRIEKYRRQHIGRAI